MSIYATDVLTSTLPDDSTPYKKVFGHALDIGTYEYSDPNAISKIPDETRSN